MNMELQYRPSCSGGNEGMSDRNKGRRGDGTSYRSTGLSWN